MKLFTSTLLLSTFFAAPAFATDSNSAGDAPAAKHFDFEDDFVEGDLQRPDGDLIVSTSKAKQRSLIEVRTNFIPEIIKMIEDF